MLAFVMTITIVQLLSLIISIYNIINNIPERPPSSRGQFIQLIVVIFIAMWGVILIFNNW